MQQTIFSEKNLKKQEKKNKILGRDEIIVKIAKSLSRGGNVVDTPLERGLQEGIKEYLKKEIESTQKLENVLAVGNKPLFKCKNMFPFDFFPDELVIDFNKVSFARHRFFSHSFDITHSLPIEDIGDVVISSAIFFSKVEIMDKSDSSNSIKMSFMHIRDAIKCRRIIQGLITARKQGIDLAAIASSNREDLIDKIEQLGRITEVP